MTLSPWVVGKTSPAMKATLRNGSGLIPINGSPSPTFQLLIINLPEDGTYSVGQGGFTILDADNSIVSYAWNAADVAASGTFALRIKVLYPDGKDDITYRQNFTIDPI